MYGGPTSRKVVMHGSDIYAIYTNYGTSPYQVYLSRSSDGGKTWSDFKVADRPYFTSYQYYPGLTIDSNGVLHAVWREVKNIANQKQTGARFTKQLTGDILPPNLLTFIKVIITAQAE